jgi:tetratricopeptide (TPR) repeat protein
MTIAPFQVQPAEVYGWQAPLKSEQKDAIRRLIEQLGDPSYSKREYARSELERIGYITLDQLQAASFHRDPQIANTARFMVNSNQFAWTSDFDPPRVREILSNFAASENEGKALHIDELARLEREEGIPGLCRLARYEANSALAKRAAIYVLKSPLRAEQSLESRKKRIAALMEDGESTACMWILAHAKSLSGFDLKFWREQLNKEQQLFASRSTETNEFVLTNLGRWIVEQCASQPELRAEALSIAQSLVDQMGLANVNALDDKSTKSIEFAQWVLGAKLHEAVRYQHSKLRYRVVLREPILSYYLAESYLQANDAETAEKIAKNALAGIPSTADGEEWKEPTDEKNDPLRSRLEGAIGYRNQSSKEKKRIIAQKLADRGLFAWAEAEYKLAADDDLTLESTLIRSLLLAELQHSQDRFADARDTLSKFQNRYENERMFREQVNAMPVLTSRVLSQYHLYAGDAAQQTGQSDEAADHYYRSIEIYPENVDALIGLYKINLDQEKAKRRKMKHAQITDLLRIQARELEEASRHANSLQYAEIVNDLVLALNSFAWIVANTEGSVEEAIVFSRQAIFLQPNDAALHDTLAHCYFADGRWADAVEQQRKAVALKPNSPTMQKALKRFEEKLSQNANTKP